ncbi:TonB-dependent Receptor Plug Domain [Solimonas aquatica]|uniref:TonB-dependent Receptor Plug Domain n=2 Tax=Solimonas aquatica TaxID=489703 RepID=A0A1H9ACY5_9GAMM|nr:TonB-dependent Receptor Plug Domain [Solimonas aquatica]
MRTTELPPTAERHATQLESITVTATKREASVRSLASSVSALSGQNMEKSGLRDVDDIVAQVPGVNIWDLQNGTTPKRITVRGISSELGTAATTGVFLDETPFNDPVAPLSVLDMNPFDLYSVEVLKGPVGTLFGGSGLNGAIRYIPEPPAFGEWQAKFFGEVGSIHQGGVSQTYGGAVMQADWVIVVGPGAGDAGGRLVASGTPHQVSGNGQSNRSISRARAAGPSPQYSAGEMTGLCYFRRSEPLRSRDALAGLKHRSDKDHAVMMLAVAASS